MLDISTKITTEQTAIAVQQSGSDEKIMDASKVLRQQQASEFGDVSDTGSRVDLLLMYQGIELL